MVPVAEIALSSNSRLPSATLAAVGRLPGGLGTNVGRANLAFSAARSSRAVCARADSLGGQTEYE